MAAWHGFDANDACAMEEQTKRSSELKKCFLHTMVTRRNKRHSLFSVSLIRLLRCVTNVPQMSMYSSRSVNLIKPIKKWAPLTATNIIPFWCGHTHTHLRYDAQCTHTCRQSRSLSYNLFTLKNAATRTQLSNRNSRTYKYMNSSIYIYMYM